MKRVKPIKIFPHAILYHFIGLPIGRLTLTCAVTLFLCTDSSPSLHHILLAPPKCLLFSVKYRSNDSTQDSIFKNLGHVTQILCQGLYFTSLWCKWCNTTNIQYIWNSHFTISYAEREQITYCMTLYIFSILGELLIEEISLPLIGSRPEFPLIIFKACAKQECCCWAIHFVCVGMLRDSNTVLHNNFISHLFHEIACAEELFSWAVNIKTLHASSGTQAA